MNGRPMEMLMWLFGYDDPHARRRLGGPPPAPRPPAASTPFVVTPDGHFNTMYRDFGEDDVMRVIDWAMATLSHRPRARDHHRPVDGRHRRGGACALPLPRPLRRRPSRSAATTATSCAATSASARCARGRGSSPRSARTSSWAENGLYLPLFIVHGTKDLPEENSGVLIDRYDELHYSVKHEHPDLGHNVWQTTYEDLKGAHWLTWHRQDPPPEPCASRRRHALVDDLWLHVEELAASDEWGEVQARARSRKEIEVQARGIAELRLDRDAAGASTPRRPITIRVDGQRVVAATPDSICIRKADGSLARGAQPGAPRTSTATSPGPCATCFHAPVLFVCGAQRPGAGARRTKRSRARGRGSAGASRVDFP